MKNTDPNNQDFFTCSGSFRILNYTVGLQMLLLGSEHMSSTCLLFKGVCGMKLMDFLEDPVIEVSYDVSKHIDKIPIAIANSKALKMYKISSQKNKFEGYIFAYFLALYELKTPFHTRIEDLPNDAFVRFIG